MQSSVKKGWFYYYKKNMKKYWPLLLLLIPIGLAAYIILHLFQAF